MTNRNKNKYNNLTQRQLEILALAANGYENNQIASILFVSKHTVKAHLSIIYKYLNAKNRAHAILMATRCNIIK